MRARAFCLITVACLAWATAACALLPQSMSNHLLTEVAEQEQKWLEKDIDSYRIVVSHVSSVWHAQTHEITVRAGEVVDQSASCIPAPTEFGKCEVQPYDAEEYTVPGLFERARSLAQFEDGEWTEIEFDTEYGYPAGMSYDHPEIVDEDSYWGVRSFEVLDGDMPFTEHDVLPGSTSNQLLTEVAEQEQKWLETDIDSYRIVVLHVSSVWHAQTHEITVRAGEVVDQSASCIPAPTEFGECEVQPYDAEEYTVPGLFERARSLAQFDDGEWTEIEFDPVYGYPAGMSYDHPEIVDEDSYWGVRSFEVLD